jgi:hypothetical protein
MEHSLVLPFFLLKSPGAGALSGKLRSLFNAFSSVHAKKPFYLGTTKPKICSPGKNFGMRRADHVHEHVNVNVHVHVNVDVKVDVDVLVNVIGFCCFGCGYAATCSFVIL